MGIEQVNPKLIDGLKYGAIALIAAIALISLSRLWQPPVTVLNTEPIDSISAQTEQAVVQIPITGPLSDRDSEISGLAWFKDTLILLPQYPSELNNALFSLQKSEILSYLNGQRTEPLTPQPIAFQSPDFEESIEGFEGFEAIAFSGNQAFLTIEAETDDTLRGYLVAGELSENLSELTISTASPAEILPQSNSPNKADEALFVAGDNIVSIYEVNGTALTPQPRANVFNAALAPKAAIPFPNLEYRVTDATELDSNNRFWVINYFYEGDSDLFAQQDPLAVEYGKGLTHSQRDTVERLVELSYQPSGITFTNAPPIQLELGPESRNWEGIVRLGDRGFLLATDKFPETMLGFVATPAVTTAP